MIDVFRKILADLDVEIYMELDNVELVEGGKDKNIININLIRNGYKKEIVIEIFSEGLPIQRSVTLIGVTKNNKNQCVNKIKIDIMGGHEDYLEAERIYKKFIERQKLRIEENENE